VQATPRMFLSSALVNFVIAGLKKEKNQAIRKICVLFSSY